MSFLSIGPLTAIVLVKSYGENDDTFTTWAIASSTYENCRVTRMLQTSISQSMSLVSPMLETSTAYSCLVTDFGSRLSIARSPRSHVQQVDYVYATLGGWLSLRCYSPQVCGNRARVSGIVPGETEIRFDLPAATSHQEIDAVSKKYSEKEVLSMQRMMTVQRLFTDTTSEAQDLGWQR